MTSARSSENRRSSVLQFGHTLGLLMSLTFARKALGLSLSDIHSMTHSMTSGQRPLPSCYLVWLIGRAHHLDSRVASHLLAVSRHDTSVCALHRIGWRGPCWWGESTTVDMHR